MTTREWLGGELYNAEFTAERQREYEAEGLRVQPPDWAARAEAIRRLIAHLDRVGWPDDDPHKGERAAWDAALVALANLGDPMVLAHRRILDEVCDRRYPLPGGEVRHTPDCALMQPVALRVRCTCGAKVTP